MTLDEIRKNKVRSSRRLFKYVINAALRRWDAMYVRFPWKRTAVTETKVSAGTNRQEQNGGTTKANGGKAARRLGVEKGRT